MSASGDTHVHCSPQRIGNRKPETKKLPYLKPELHLLDLDDTEGKAKNTSETTAAGSITFGPS